jgi:hypothetical protein
LDLNRFYAWGFLEIGVLKIGETKYTAELRKAYAMEKVQRFTGSTEHPILLLEDAQDDARLAETVWRQSLMNAGLRPLWGSRDFFRLKPACLHMATAAGFEFSWTGVYKLS